MSFRDIESGSGAARARPGRRRDDDSAIEREIKSNIQRLQDFNRNLNEQLERSSRQTITRRTVTQMESLHAKSRDIAKATEQSFREWTVHLAGEPHERNRKKFSYEKLYKAFQAEGQRLGRIAQGLTEASRLVDRQTDVDLDVLVDLECGGSSPSSESAVLLENNNSLGDQVVQEGQIQDRIAREREQGISNIQSQVYEVNQIFRDLASIVTDQGERIVNIEMHAEQSASDTGVAAKELRRAQEMQKVLRDRICWVFVGAIALFLLLLFFHSHQFVFSKSAAPVSVHSSSVQTARSEAFNLIKGTTESASQEPVPTEPFVKR